MKGITWSSLIQETKEAIRRSSSQSNLQLIVKQLGSTDPAFAADALMLWQRRYLKYFFNPALSVDDFATCARRGWSDCGSAAAICAAAARLVDPQVPLRLCYEQFQQKPGYAHAKLILGRGHVVDTWREFAIDVQTCDLTGWL